MAPIIFVVDKDCAHVHYPDGHSGLWTFGVWTFGVEGWGLRTFGVEDVRGYG